MNTKYDKKIDAKYVSIKKGKVDYTKKEKEWLLFDYDNNGDVLGVEILNASKNLVTISTIKDKLSGYSIVEFIRGDDNESLELNIKSPEYAKKNQFVFG